MNQPTHAWLAVEAYRKVESVSRKDKRLKGLASLLGEHLKDVVVAAWLPDSLIKDMTYGHVFKNSVYKGGQTERFTLRKKDLKARISGDYKITKMLDGLPGDWWEMPYRVKENGGHLPARVNALCQSARDMLKMGDDGVVSLTKVGPSKKKGEIARSLLYPACSISVTLWMASHYIADAHVPFHCDNRSLASTTDQDTHCDVEKLWGAQVSELFHSNNILRCDNKKILDAPMPEGSSFGGIDFGDSIGRLKNNGDPWKEAVYICRASFAASFAIVPPGVADVDDRKTKVSLEDILSGGFCGKERFWEIKPHSHARRRLLHSHVLAGCLAGLHRQERGLKTLPVSETEK